MYILQLNKVIMMMMMMMMMIIIIIIIIIIRLNDDLDVSSIYIDIVYFT